MREVAKKVKVSISTLSRLENGKTPDMPSLINVCNWLESSPSTFFKAKVKNNKNK
jgi:transcriptional regulator with XRE-family HTH domain